MYYNPRFDTYFAQHGAQQQALCANGTEPTRAQRLCDECSQNDICAQLLAYEGEPAAIVWLANDTEF